MKSSYKSNRAICIGDRVRAGIGAPTLSNGEILSKMARWSIPSLRKFIKTCQSHQWKEAAIWMLSQKEGLDRQIKKLQDKRNSRRKKRSQAREVPPLS